jgi:hypothetical protein
MAPVVHVRNPKNVTLYGGSGTLPLVPPIAVAPTAGTKLQNSFGSAQVKQASAVNDLRDFHDSASVLRATAGGTPVT